MITPVSNCIPAERRAPAFFLAVLFCLGRSICGVVVSWLEQLVQPQSNLSFCLLAVS